MRDRTLLIAVLGTVLLVGAGVAGALAMGSGSASASQPDHAGKSISVSATGQVEATPDQAVVRVAVTATGDDSNAVRKALASDVKSMRAALREYGLSDDAIRTLHYDISQDRRRGSKGGETTQYRGVHAFQVTVNDTSAAGEVVDVAVQNGADRVMGVSFTLSEKKRERLHDRALTRAMENARSRAGTLAAAGNIEVTGVHAIVSTETRYQAYTVKAAAVGAADGGTSVESGPVTVTASVRVTYNATAA